MTDSSVLQDDLREMLQALGMNDGAQPKSPHEVFQEALTEMKRRLAGRELAHMGFAEIIEQCAQVAVAMTQKWGDPNGNDYQQGAQDNGIRIIHQIRSLIHNDAAPPPQTAASTAEPVAARSATTQLIDQVFDIVSEIEGLSQHLRSGGPDAMDLQGLSDGLSQACDLATAASDLLAKLALAIAVPTTSPKPICGPIDFGPDWKRRERAMDGDTTPEPSSSPEIPDNSNCSKSSNGSPKPDAVREQIVQIIAEAMDDKADSATHGYQGANELDEERAQASADAILAALSRPAHGGWEDISTAPKDGTEILAYSEHGGTGTMLVRHIALCDFLTDAEVEQLAKDGMTDNEIETADWFCADFIAGARLSPDCEPTHWQPVPLARNDRGSEAR